MPSDRISVIFERALAEQLQDVPSVSIRLKDPETYKKSSVRVAGVEGLQFTSSMDGYEKIAFVRKANTLLTVAFVSSGDPDTRNDLAYILKSFRWK